MPRQASLQVVRDALFLLSFVHDNLQSLSGAPSFYPWRKSVSISEALVTTGRKPIAVRWVDTSKRREDKSKLSFEIRSKKSFAETMIGQSGLRPRRP